MHTVKRERERVHDMRRHHVRCAMPPTDPSEPQTDTNPYVLQSSNCTNNQNSRFAQRQPQISSPEPFWSPTQTRFLFVGNPNQNKTPHNHQISFSSIIGGECALVCSDARLYVSELLDVRSTGQKSSCSKDMYGVIKCWHDERMISNPQGCATCNDVYTFWSQHKQNPIRGKSNA